MILLDSRTSFPYFLSEFKTLGIKMHVEKFCLDLSRLLVSTMTEPDVSCGHLRHPILLVMELFTRRRRVFLGKRQIMSDIELRPTL